jgi:hypothetical protein
MQRTTKAVKSTKLGHRLTIIKVEHIAFRQGLDLDNFTPGSDLPVSIDDRYTKQELDYKSADTPAVKAIVAATNVPDRRKGLLAKTGFRCL